MSWWIIFHFIDNKQLQDKVSENPNVPGLVNGTAKVAISWIIAESGKIFIYYHYQNVYSNILGCNTQPIQPLCLSFSLYILGVFLSVCIPLGVCLSVCIPCKAFLPFTRKFFTLPNPLQTKNSEKYKFYIWSAQNSVKRVVGVHFWGIFGKYSKDFCLKFCLKRSNFEAFFKTKKCTGFWGLWGFKAPPHSLWVGKFDHSRKG